MLPFCLANLAAFREDLLHEIISAKDCARAAPIFGMLRSGMLGKQGTDLFLQCCHSFFKGYAGHNGTSPLEVVGIQLIVSAPATSGKSHRSANVDLMAGEQPRPAMAP
jgi:hypothetical protein